MVGTLTGKVRHVLLAGGGHAHAVALRQLVKRPPAPGLRLTLIAPSTHNLYSGALPGVISGHWTEDAIGVPLPPLCKAAGVEFNQDSIVSIDASSKTVRLANGELISFDLASLDVGSGIRELSVSGSKQDVVAIRPIAPFLKHLTEALATIKTGKRPPSIIVIGGGLAGIEVALALQYRLHRENISDPQVTLVDASEAIAASNSPALRRRLEHALDRAGVSLCLNTRLQAVENGSANLSSGETIEAALVVNCAGSAPHPWIGQSDLNTVNGRVEIDACLRSTSHPHIWAAGDTSHFKPKPVEPAGVFAVRAGPIIAENIRRFSRNAPLTAFSPQTDYLKLVSLGEKRAIAEKFGFTMEGGWVWKLKKSIDFSFLREHSLPTGN
jgi:selenide,water dikinase